MTVGEKIVELRQKNNVYQKDLAKFLGVGVSCLSLWEKGQRQISVEQLKKVAEFFNVSIDYLTGLSPIEKEELTEEERELIEIIKELNEEQTQELSNYLDFIIAKRDKKI